MDAPLIVSASRRTDVPAFHARWFERRLAAGFCEVRHPYTGRVHRVSLDPACVSAYVFWTRQPAPLLRTMATLHAAGCGVLVQFTINGYGPPIESHNPPRRVALRAFERAATALGPDAVLWRYDPILLAPDLPPAEHLRRFRDLARALEGMTRRCTFSFVDFYGKTTRNLASIERAREVSFERPEPQRKRALAQELGGIAREHGMELLSCCDDDLVGGNVGKSRCIDPAAIERVMGRPLGSVPASPTRKDCGCVRSADIGAYDTCAFGCAYCYAVRSRDRALEKIRARDDDDTMLSRPASSSAPDSIP